MVSLVDELDCHQSYVESGSKWICSGSKWNFLQSEEKGGFGQRVHLYQDRVNLQNSVWWGITGCYIPSKLCVVIEGNMDEVNLRYLYLVLIVLIPLELHIFLVFWL